MNRWRPSKPILIISGLAVALLLFTGQALAQKLVIFKNGKILRVKSVETEDGWARLEISTGNIIGVHPSQIAGVEDAGDDPASGKKPAPPNQAITGGRGVPGGGESTSPRVGRRISVPQQEDDYADEEAEEEQEQQDRLQSRGKSTAPRSTPPISGIQPLKDAAANRGFNRFRRNNSFSNTRGNFGAKPAQPDQQEEADRAAQEDDDE